MKFEWILLLAFDMVSTGKNDISITDNTKPWISVENYKTILKLSFPLSVCCNVYLGDMSRGVDAIFKQFVHNYPYQYLVRKKIIDCQGYFLVSSSTESLIRPLQKIPSTISTSELLIVVDIELAEIDLLFNVSIYKNANVNLIARNGIWHLSENYLEKRHFLRVEKHEDLIYGRGLADFKGRELQVAAFYMPPLCYLNRTINKTVNQIEGEFYLADNEHERDGVEMKMFMLMADRLNFTWTIRKPTLSYRYGRQINDTAWNGGMIGQMVRKEIDMAFTGIWLKQDHYLFTNLTESWYQLFITFLVPRPRRFSSFWGITRPFTPLVWTMIVLSLLFMTIYMLTRANVKPKTPKRFRHFALTVTELIGRLTGVWVPRNTTEVRIPMHLWQLSSLLLVSAYSCSLAARLTSSEYEGRIDNLQQFIEANLTWGRQGPVPIFKEYFDLSNRYAAELPKRFEHENDSESRHKKILNGNYAVVGRIVGALFFPEDNVTNEDLKGYRVMKETVGQFYASFAVQPWLLHPINTIMLRIKEGGLNIFHLEDVVRRRAGLSLREVLVERDKNDGVPRVLSITPLGAGFSFLLVGLLVSCVTFYLEIRSVRNGRSTRAVLHDIEKKRISVNNCRTVKVRVIGIKRVTYKDA
ncbi:Ionotrophic receptor 101 [Cephus cinctus]|uniref:Probable glutamate receptor n=1 Tax=Cephus cinctus TaxID=211228 RepID=A0A3L9LUS8_CEPCN|nr:probable glutamate receptor [Cephus cinctus]RLZ02267.1 Ionotrophic receptor 101 [Cephus cinctus]